MTLFKKIALDASLLLNLCRVDLIYFVHLCIYEFIYLCSD